MAVAIKAPKDFWTGVLYIGIGTSAMWVGAGYPMGSATRMGYGYFPKVLAGLLIFFGVVSIVRSIRTSGSPIDAMAFKPFFLVLGSCALFAVLLPLAGFFVAVLALGLMSAAASVKFSFDPKIVLGLFALTACCSLLFITFLGIPMPLFGQWLDPVLGPYFSWLR